MVCFVYIIDILEFDKKKNFIKYDCGYKFKIFLIIKLLRGEYFVCEDVFCIFFFYIIDKYFLWLNFEIFLWNNRIWI